MALLWRLWRLRMYAVPFPVIPICSNSPFDTRSAESLEEADNVDSIRLRKKLIILALLKRIVLIPIKNYFKLFIILAFNEINCYPCVLAFTQDSLNTCSNPSIRYILDIF